MSSATFSWKSVYHTYGSGTSALSPVHTSNNVEATLSNATKSNVASTWCGPGVTCDTKHCMLVSQ